MNNGIFTTVSFTGHRSYDGRCNNALRRLIRRLYEQGYRIFMTGMAQGFDLEAGECVAELKNELPELRLCCLIPFEGQSDGYSPAERRRYDRLRASADEAVVLDDHYYAGVYHRRNDALVDCASVMVAYFDGSAGGTAYTVRRAEKKGLLIYNLCERQ